MLIIVQFLKIPKWMYEVWMKSFDNKKLFLQENVKNNVKKIKNAVRLLLQQNCPFMISWHLFSLFSEWVIICAYRNFFIASKILWGEKTSVKYKQGKKRSNNKQRQKVGFAFFCTKSDENGRFRYQSKSKLGSDLLWPHSKKPECKSKFEIPSNMVKMRKYPA